MSSAMLFSSFGVVLLSCLLALHPVLPLHTTAARSPPLDDQDDPLRRDVDDADLNQRLDNATERGFYGVTAPAPALTPASTPDGGAVGWAPDDGVSDVRVTLPVPAGACVIGLAWDQHRGGGRADSLRLSLSGWLCAHSRTHPGAAVHRTISYLRMLRLS